MMHRPTRRLLAGCLLFAVSCCQPTPADDTEKSKKEILQAEKDFEVMVKQKGLAEAFAFYADSSAVMRRGKTLVKGRDAIRQFYLNDTTGDFSLTWKAEFADASGRLGYTYGQYIWNAKDSSGAMIGDTGVFHTVWKKQKDGNWKFVWD